MRVDGKRNMERILEVLPATQLEIQRRTGLSASATCRWVQFLSLTDGVHIIGYHQVPNGGPMQAIYQRGKGVSVAKPSPKPDSERTRKYRKRLRRTGAWHEVKSKARGRYWADNARRDPLTAAFFGEAK